MDKPHGPIIAQDKEGRFYLPKSTLIWFVTIVLGGGVLTGGGRDFLHSLIDDPVPIPVEVTAPQIESAVEEAIHPIQTNVQSIERSVDTLWSVAEVAAKTARENTKAIENHSDEIREVGQQVSRTEGKVDLLIEQLIEIPNGGSAP